MIHSCIRDKCCMCGKGFGILHTGWITHDGHKSHTSCVQENMMITFLNDGSRVFVLENTQVTKGGKC